MEMPQIRPKLPHLTVKSRPLSYQGSLYACSMLTAKLTARVSFVIIAFLSLVS